MRTAFIAHLAHLRATGCDGTCDGCRRFERASRRGLRIYVLLHVVLLAFGGSR